MVHRTDDEVRAKHWWTGVLGVLFVGCGLMLHFLAGQTQTQTATPGLERLASVGTRAGEAAGDVAFLLAVLCVAWAIAHRWWYFQPRQVFRRELGGAQGWLDRHDLATSAGAAGIRRATAAGSPREGSPVTDHGWKVGVLVTGLRSVRYRLAVRAAAPWKWIKRRAVYSPWARGVGIVGPQGSGKTQFLVNLILDSPGAVIAPSTKPELVVLTRELRERRGPTAVFNPGQLGTIGSDFRWDPIGGCNDQGVADRRAWAMVRGAGGAAGVDRADFWAGKAQEILRCYLMAAALGGRDMSQVMRWANNPDDPDPVNILNYYGARVPQGWLPTLQTHLGATPNTKTGYFATVTSCVGFMDSPSVVAACTPGPGAQLTVEELLRRRGTLYLVGSAGDRRLAPLITALTEYVFDAAQREAAALPGGRLSPTLNFILDEVANTTPVPLDRWASDSRGWGITVVAVVQSLAQFATTWGRDRAEVIWENLPTKVVLPGVTNKDDLTTFSYLAGERWVQRVTRGESVGHDGRSSASTSSAPTQEPVIAGHTISAMPQWHAFVLGLGRHPAIVRYEPGYLRVAREQADVPASPVAMVATPTGPAERPFLLPHEEQGPPPITWLFPRKEDQGP